MDAVVGDGAHPHMGEGADGVVGADLGGVDLAGVDGGAGADDAVLDQGVGPDDAAGADDGVPPQDGAGKDPGPRGDLDRLVNIDVAAVNQDACRHVPQQDGFPGRLGGVQFGPHGLDGIFFHEKNLLFIKRASPARNQKRFRGGFCRKIRGGTLFVPKKGLQPPRREELEK